MALYTTTASAAARLGRYAGLAVPSFVPAGTSPLDDLILEASNLVEAYIGYAWAPNQALTETIPIGRDGQGQLMGADGLLCPVTGITSIAVPAGAQYYGATITLANTENLANGEIVLAYPVVYTPQQWVNPIPLGRSAGYNAALKLYPENVTVAYTAGRTDPPPGIFADVCMRLMAILLLKQDDPDSLMASKQKVADLGLATDYRQDALADALAPLKRWRR